MANEEKRPSFHLIKTIVDDQAPPPRPPSPPPQLRPLLDTEVFKAPANPRIFQTGSSIVNAIESAIGGRLDMAYMVPRSVWEKNEAYWERKVEETTVREREQAQRNLEEVKNDFETRYSQQMMRQFTIMRDVQVLRSGKSLLEFNDAIEYQKNLDVLKAEKQALEHRIKTAERELAETKGFLQLSNVEHAHLKEQHRVDTNMIADLNEKIAQLEKLRQAAGKISDFHAQGLAEQYKIQLAQLEEIRQLRAERMERMPPLALLQPDSAGAYVGEAHSARGTSPLPAARARPSSPPQTVRKFLPPFKSLGQIFEKENQFAKKNPERKAFFKKLSSDYYARRFNWLDNIRDPPNDANIAQRAEILRQNADIVPRCVDVELDGIDRICGGNRNNFHTISLFMSGEIQYYTAPGGEPRNPNMVSVIFLNPLDAMKFVEYFLAETPKAEAARDFYGITPRLKTTMTLDIEVAESFLKGATRSFKIVFLEIAADSHDDMDLDDWLRRFLPEYRFDGTEFWIENLKPYQGNKKQTIFRWFQFSLAKHAFKRLMDGPMGRKMKMTWVPDPEMERGGITRYLDSYLPPRIRNLT